MSGRPALRKCYGTNPRTGHGVGERHKWSGGWGLGRCVFCHRDLDELTRSARKEPEPGSAEHLKRAREEGDEHRWTTMHWGGMYGSAAGYYVRKGPQWCPQWLSDEKGKARCFATQGEANAAADIENARV